MENTYRMFLESTYNLAFLGEIKAKTKNEAVKKLDEDWKYKNLGIFSDIELRNIYRNSVKL